jgi:hypothetical protein
MTEKLIVYRNNIFIIQRYHKIITGSQKDIEFYVDKVGTNKKDFFRDLLAKYPDVFKNYSIVNFYKKLEAKSWNVQQNLTIYEHLKNENNVALIKEYMKVIESIEPDLDASPYKIEWLQSYFMNKKKNFKSRYYWPDRWGTDPNFMEDIYKLLFHAENFDLEAVV